MESPEDRFLQLRSAAHSRDLAALQQQLDAGLPLDGKFGPDEQTPLHMVVGREWAEGVAALIERGADLRISDRYGYTPMHMAANGHKRGDVLRSLLAAGGDAHLRVAGGATPLEIAVILVDERCVRTFLEADSSAHALLCTEEFWSSMEGRVGAGDAQEKAGAVERLRRVVASHTFAQNLHSAMDSEDPAPSPTERGRGISPL